ncbi:MAG: uracil-DNA glycosylase family protein [Paracoccaceae bacterium]
MTESIDSLKAELAGCEICKDRFAATLTAHSPRPVIWFSPGARILIAGQAPGQRVHSSGKPFTDPSGDRLRDWMGIDETTFYDRTRIGIVPMAFCFPGYDSKGSDLPPPPVCALTWRGRIMDQLGTVPLTLLVGGHAIKWHLKDKSSVTDSVTRWRDHAPEVFALPHPSWRNTGWLKKNPWFEADLLPVLRARVQEVLNDG